MLKTIFKITMSVLTILLLVFVGVLYALTDVRIDSVLGCYSATTHEGDINELCLLANNSYTQAKIINGSKNVFNQSSYRHLQYGSMDEERNAIELSDFIQTFSPTTFHGFPSTKRDMDIHLHKTRLSSINFRLDLGSYHQYFKSRE